MKRILPAFFAACGLILLLAGCGHLDVSREGDPNRVLSGTVNVRMNLLPPPDSEVLVRLVSAPDVTAAPTKAANDLVIGERGTRSNPETVVGEQVIRAPSAVPVSFHIEYRASDDELRRGLNLEARISWGGQVRFRTIEGQVVTLATVNDPQTIWVEPVR